MVIEWKCPHCQEPHISKAEEIGIFELHCSKCDKTTIFVIQEQKRVFECECIVNEKIVRTSIKELY